jgi:hypothetical protein
MNDSTPIVKKATRIPVIQTGQALQSLRDSGHSLPTAVAEPVDNSVEAGAHNIWVRLDQAKDQRGKAHVHRIVIADDGRGMDIDTLHHYLVLGFSTRYMRKDTIGKYGVGAKLAALNFGRRIDVWSRTEERDPWMHVHFDLDEALKSEQLGGEVGVDSPVSNPAPEHCKEMMPPGTGTVVVWSRVDRLDDERLAQDFNELRLELEKELSRMFRYFIDGGIKLFVNAKSLFPHDPLMLLEHTWADQVLSQRAAKTAAAKGNKSKDDHGDHFPGIEIGRENLGLGESRATVIVTVYPNEAIRKPGAGGDSLAKELRIPDNLGAISFVRRNREVSYTNVPRIFPGGVLDPDRYIGIEVQFNPDMDEYFGVRNVKRGVEPHGELRRQLREALQKHIPTARKRIEEVRGALSREEKENIGEHAPLLQAVKDIDNMLPQSRAESNNEPSAVLDSLALLATDVGVKADERPEFIEKRKDLPVIVESVDFPGTMFIATEHVNGKVIIRLNTRHKFYRELWEPIRTIADSDSSAITGQDAVRAASRTIEALTLLLVAYGRAESMHRNPVDQYEDLLNHWGQFLSTMLGKIKHVR